MNQDFDNNSSFLQIKELKEKVRSLVSEVDLNRENTKFKHENYTENNLTDSVYSDQNDDDFIDCSEAVAWNETNWLSEDSSSSESVKEICSKVYMNIDEYRPDITEVCYQLESCSIDESPAFSGQRASIDSRTFTRPKKCTTRPPLTSILNTPEEVRPKLQRRLTTTISPTPNLISKLEELSKSNNRPVSGQFTGAHWEDGCEESLADARRPVKSKRQSLPTSLFDRLQELKKANSSFKTPNVNKTTLINGDNQGRESIVVLEDAKKVMAALDIYGKHAIPSPVPEIFKNVQDYCSDDNESFINLDEVSGFCDRLTLSTDQNTYSSIVREMEQNEICLFHRTTSEEKSKKNRFTFGGMDIPGLSPSVKKSDSSNEEDCDLNRTYEIDEESEKANTTFEIRQNLSKQNLNSTYDANKKTGSPDGKLQSPVIKTSSVTSDPNICSDNINNNNTYNKYKTYEETNIVNRNYDRYNDALDQIELNVTHTEKYSTKLFDSNFKKTEPEIARSPKNRNGKKDSDHSEDDCMSITSDNSCRSVDSNSDPKTLEELKNIAIYQNKKFSSTPITDHKSVATKASKLTFGVVSPIRMEMGDGDPLAYSNASSRGLSPKRMPPLAQSETVQKQRMPNLKQPLKVPQRELKLKPAMIRPSQILKKPLTYARTSSEPSVPQKLENYQPSGSVPVLRPSGPIAVPSLINVRPSSRTSGIPRPPTRLKQPQIRLNYSKK